MSVNNISVDQLNKITATIREVLTEYSTLVILEDASKLNKQHEREISESASSAEQRLRCIYQNRDLFIQELEINYLFNCPENKLLFRFYDTSLIKLLTICTEKLTSLIFSRYQVTNHNRISKAVERIKSDRENGNIVNPDNNQENENKDHLAEIVKTVYGKIDYKRIYLYSEKRNASQVISGVLETALSKKRGKILKQSGPWAWSEGEWEGWIEHEFTFDFLARENFSRSYNVLIECAFVIIKLKQCIMQSRCYYAPMDFFTDLFKAPDKIESDIPLNGNESFTSEQVCASPVSATVIAFKYYYLFKSGTLPWLEGQGKEDWVYLI